jgi:teichuronic acid biosynthesis glycosyltransferase TuaH
MGGTFVVGSHHLAKGYASQGHAVTHLTPAVTPAHASLVKRPFERERLRRWWRGGRLINGVRDVIPGALLTWGMARQLGNPYERYGRCVYPSAMRQLKRIGAAAPDVIFIDEPRLGYLLQAWPNARVVYRPTDVYAQIRNDPSITDAERSVIARANAFIATSEPVAAHLRALGASDVLVLENGVDLAHFTTGPDYDVEAELPPQPRAVYAGALDHRFGVDSLVEAASNNPSMNFVVIGPPNKSISQQLEALPNVWLLGAIPYEKLPSYLRRCQLALLPLSADPSNQGRSPMKIFEYAALGLTVVATATEELQRRQLPFLLVAQSPQDFSFLVAQIVSNGLPYHREDAIAFAASQNWLQKCNDALAHTMKAVQ